MDEFWADITKQGQFSISLADAERIRPGDIVPAGRRAVTVSMAYPGAVYDPGRWVRSAPLIPPRDLGAYTREQLTETWMDTEHVEGPPDQSFIVEQCDWEGQRVPSFLKQDV